MRNRAAVLLPSAFVALFLAVVWSCGSDSGNPTKPKPDPDPDPDPPLSHSWTPNVVGLPPADSALLDSAASHYRALRLAGDAPSARTALVAALTSGWAGVANAGVTVDGTTIQINFTDGVKAIITTNELFQTFTGGYSVGLRVSSVAEWAPETQKERATECASKKESKVGTECGDAVVPSDHKVRIVNPATATNADAVGIRTQLEHGFTQLGWNDLDIDVRESGGSSDRTFTPKDLLDQTSTGQVVYAAESAVISLDANAPSSGNNAAYAMQAFNGGEYSEYEQHSTPQEWAQYEQWQKEGKLIHGKTWSSSNQVMVDQVFILEDLLATEITLEDGAMVHFISPHSGTKSNLEGMVNRGGASSASGWDGFVKPEPAATALLTMVEGMVGTEGDPKGQVETLNTMKEHGQAHMTQYQDVSTLIVEALPDGRVFLPAHMKFDAPFDCLEAGTVYYDVDVKYSDCPELNQSFHFFPGGTHSLTGLPPMGAEISFQAKDADGKVLGAGIYDLDLTGGPNDVDLCPCYGKIDLDFPDFSSIPGIDAGSKLIGDFLYSDPNIPDKSWSGPVAEIGDLPGVEGVPGQAKAAFRVEDGQGDVLGYAKLGEDIELRCDANLSMDLCLGWMRFTAGSVPPETSSIVISGTSNATWVDPPPATLTPGGEVNMMGLAVGENVHFTSEARSGSGEVLGEFEADQEIECGPNDFTIRFNDFGLVLYTDKDRAPASGYAGAIITGVLRKWQEGDTDVPTGEGLPGVEVHLSTDLGGFQVAPLQYLPEVSKTTNEGGWFGTVLTSTNMGTATVSARTDEPEVEADPVTVEFERPIKLVIDNSSDPYDGTVLPDSAHAIRQYCVITQKWTNGELDIERTDLGRAALSNHYTGHHVVGEELKFVWIPGTNCPADDFYTGPYISGSYLHYYYGEDYGNQVTKFMIGEKNPLTQTVEFTTTLADPSGPPPSPFDLTAPEKYVLSGFRDQPPARARRLRE